MHKFIKFAKDKIRKVVMKQKSYYLRIDEKSNNII